MVLTRWTLLTALGTTAGILGTYLYVHDLPAAAFTIVMMEMFTAWFIMCDIWVDKTFERDYRRARAQARDWGTYT